MGVTDRRDWAHPARGSGCRLLPARLLIGLLYLQHAYNLSDEAVGQRWLENAYFQYFCGEVVFQTRRPCVASSLTRYRKRMGGFNSEVRHPFFAG